MAGVDRLGGIAVSPAVRRILAGMDKWTPTMADIPTGDTRPVKTLLQKPTGGRFFNRHGSGSRAKEEKYLAQRRLRGLGDALLGSADLANMVINAGIADINLLTGGLGGKRDVELSMPSQDAANFLTDITGTKIVEDEEVSPAVRQEGANQRALMGALPTGVEDVTPVGGIGAMFVGVGSKLANKATLEAAKTMEKVGADRATILKDTGWFKQHGDWKYEIPDEKSHLWSSARSDINAGNTRTLGQPGTFSHPELYEAYPEIRDVELHNRVVQDNLGTQYPGTPGSIGVKQQLPPAMHDILLHEVQHKVQDIENFPRGGQPTQFSDADKQLYDNAWTVRNRMDLLGETAEEAAEYIGKNAGIDPVILADLAKSHSGPELSAKRREASPQEQYRRLAGETEARNVEFRRPLTAEARRTTPPWETQDVPDELQIVQRRGPGSANVEKTASAVVDPVAPKGLGVRAYHGSPHSFEEFDISKIGTGEGAQAYGHGLYFAENEDVARGYRERLAGTKANEGTVEGAVERALAEDNPRQWLEGQSRSATNALKRYPDNQYLVEQAQRYDDAIKLLEGGYKPAGSMYEVDIAADPETFLDWDKPLSEQPTPVQQSLAKLGVTLPTEVEDVGLRGIINRAIRMNGGDADPHSISLLINNDQNLFKAAEQHARMSGIDVDNDMNWASPGDYVTEKADAYLRGRSVTGEDIHRRMGERPDTASKMREAGLPGIKYLDAGSRAGGLGSRNYVVFDPKIIKIVKKYGLAAAISAGLISEEMGRQMQAQGEL